MGMAERIINVRHPATVLTGHDDGTGRDVTWLACTTPVRVRERDPASFRLVQRHARFDASNAVRRAPNTRAT